MSSNMKAKWHNGIEQITGRWSYHWASDRFSISLDNQPKNKKSGQFRNLDFTVFGDSPEFGKWKLIREESCQIKEGL